MQAAPTQQRGPTSLKHSVCHVYLGGQTGRRTPCFGQISATVSLFGLADRGKRKDTKISNLNVKKVPALNLSLKVNVAALNLSLKVGVVGMKDLEHPAQFQNGRIMCLRTCNGLTQKQMMNISGGTGCKPYETGLFWQGMQTVRRVSRNVLKNFRGEQSRSCKRTMLMESLNITLKSMR